MKSATGNRTRLSRGLQSFGVSIAALMVMVLWVGDGAHFLGLIRSFAPHVLVISLVAGVLRFAIPREGAMVSLITGLVTAIGGYAVVYLTVMSSI